MLHFFKWQNNQYFCNYVFWANTCIVTQDWLPFIKLQLLNIGSVTITTTLTTSEHVHCHNSWFVIQSSKTEDLTERKKLGEGTSFEGFGQLNIWSIQQRIPLLESQFPKRVLNSLVEKLPVYKGWKENIVDRVLICKKNGACVCVCIYICIHVGYLSRSS